MHVLCFVGTRGRYDTTLPITLQAIHSQTRPPDTFVLIDDNPPAQRFDLRTHPVYSPLLTAMANRMQVHVLFGPGRGPHANHEFARTCEFAKELIWRVDDDEAPEQNALALLEMEMAKDPRLGAVGGLVLTPGPAQSNPHASSQLEDVYTCQNVQWFRWPPGTRFADVGHLHSTYLYRKDLAAFPNSLSSAGHSEETQHTIRIKMAGFRLAVLPEVITWHYRQPGGGIRSQESDTNTDRSQYMAFLDSLPVTFRKRLPIVAGQGWGDCFALWQALPSILPIAREKFDEIHLFVRPELCAMFTRWNGDKVTVHPMPELGQWNFSGEFNVYSWWAGAEQHHKWKGNLVDAYRDMYLERIEKGVAQ